MQVKLKFPKMMQLSVRRRARAFLSSNAKWHYVFFNSGEKLNDLKSLEANATRAKPRRST